MDKINIFILPENKVRGGIEMYDLVGITVSICLSVHIDLVRASPPTQMVDFNETLHKDSIPPEDVHENK